MSKNAALAGIIALCVLALLPRWASADTWPAPQTRTTSSSSGAYRVTIVPKSWGTQAASPQGLERALGRVEHGVSGRWRLVWERHLVNSLAPIRALLTDDGGHLVTFDNWGSAGLGDDVVVIYDDRGRLVRKLSLEQILSPAYLRHLPRTISSRGWGGEHRLVDGDTAVELQILEPGAERGPAGTYVPVRIRLSDGALIRPAGPAWQRAMVKLGTLEAQRQARWEKFRRMRASPLRVPSSRDTLDWTRYKNELGARLFGESDFRFGGIVLAAPGASWGSDAADVADWIGDWRRDPHYHTKLFFLSPTSDRLADALVTSLRKRGPGSMTGLHLVFVGTAAEGKRVSEAAAHAGARLTLVDRAKPFPPGRPLPSTPPDYF